MLVTEDKNPGMSIKEQFMHVWPVLSSWIADNFEAAILKQRSHRLLMASWKIWVDEAAIFPPPLVSSSDSDNAYVGHRVYASPYSLQEDGDTSSDDGDGDTPIIMMNVNIPKMAPHKWQAKLDHLHFMTGLVSKEVGIPMKRATTLLTNMDSIAMVTIHRHRRRRRREAPQAPRTH